MDPKGIDVAEKPNTAYRMLASMCMMMFGASSLFLFSVSMMGYTNVFSGCFWFFLLLIPAIPIASLRYAKKHSLYLTLVAAVTTLLLMAYLATQLTYPAPAPAPAVAPIDVVPISDDPVGTKPIVTTPDADEVSNFANKLYTYILDIVYPYTEEE